MELAGEPEFHRSARSWIGDVGGTAEPKRSLVGVAGTVRVCSRFENQQELGRLAVHDRPSGHDPTLWNYDGERRVTWGGRVARRAPRDTCAIPHEGRRLKRAAELGRGDGEGTVARDLVRRGSRPDWVLSSGGCRVVNHFGVQRPI